MALALVLTLGGCAIAGTLRPAEESVIAMDTFIRVRVYGRGAAASASAAIAEFVRLDRLLNPYDESSEVAAVNRAAGVEAVKVGPDTLGVIERALAMAAETGGAFDPTVLPLVRAWGFGAAPRVPGDSEIEEALSLVDYRLVEVDRQNSTVKLMKKGMGLDLGAIAKGYATDRAVEVLRERGVKSALVDAGGNIYAIGSRPSGILGFTPWSVAVRHPRESGVSLATLKVSDTSVVTSGDYQRFFEAGGVRFHHILDPRTGRPAGEFMSVTVTGPSSTDADALSTAVFASGESTGFDLVRRRPGFGVIAMKPDGTVATAGDPPAGDLPSEHGRR